MAGSGGPLDVLVVGWYPGADDPIAGRFIADQAEALAGTGRVRPLVASFEPFWLHGDRRTRSEAARDWPEVVEAAGASGLIPMPCGAYGPTGVPVARLGVPAGTTPWAGHDNEVVHRSRTLAGALRGMRRPVDLVHGHVGYPDGAAAARVARQLGVPFVMTEHATYLARILGDPVFRARYREAGLAAGRVIAVSRMLAEQIVAELPELGDRTVIIPNTVDIAAFPPVEPAGRDGNELLWVGYRREVKGTGVLLRAFAQVRSQRPATTLRLVGRSTSDEEEEGWRSLAGELGITDAVRFDGPTDRAGVVAAMARAGLFVHPGTRETFGIVAAEALASGLPVVATDSGGVTEVLGDDPDTVGGLVPVDDVEALAAAILRALDRRMTFDPAVLRAHVEARYAAHAVAARLADLYDDVLATSPGRRAPTHARPGHSADTPGEPPLPSPPASPVLVAFDRPALDRLLPRCPAWLLEGLVVVTRGTDVTGVRATVSIPETAEPALATLLAWRSVGRPFPSPIRWLRRLRKRARLQASVLPSLAAALERGIDVARAVEPAHGHDRSEQDPQLSVDTGQPLVLCLGGIDVATARRVASTGHGRLAPGGLRWLGDARWGAGHAAAAATSGTAGTGDDTGVDV